MSDKKKLKTSKKFEHSKYKIMFYAISIIVIIIVAVVIKDYFEKNDNDGVMTNPNSFIPQDYYDSTLMNYMGTIFENKSDIETFTEAFSHSTNCPWGFIHTGIDYMYYNNSKVLAAIPGQITEISYLDAENSGDYHIVHMVIRYNLTLWVDYAFEPFSPNKTDQIHQRNLINANLGDWVNVGDEIARFLRVQEYAHIHFDVFEGTYFGPEDETFQYNPTKYFSPEAYIKTLDMIQSFNPTWEIYYP